MSGGIGFLVWLFGFLCGAVFMASQEPDPNEDEAELAGVRVFGLSVAERERIRSGIERVRRRNREIARMDERARR